MIHARIKLKPSYYKGKLIFLISIHTRRQFTELLLCEFNIYPTSRTLNLLQLSMLKEQVTGYREYSPSISICITYPDSKVHGANMGPIWGRHGPGEPHVGPMNFAIWVVI